MLAVSARRQRGRKISDRARSGCVDSAPNVHPVWATANEGDVTGQINNSTVAEQMAMDYQPGRGYLMDHYTVFPQDGMAAITEFGPQFDPDEQ